MYAVVNTRAVVRSRRCRFDQREQTYRYRDKKVVLRTKKYSSINSFTAEYNFRNLFLIIRRVRYVSRYGRQQRRRGRQS